MPQIKFWMEGTYIFVITHKEKLLWKTSEDYQERAYPGTSNSANTLIPRLWAYLQKVYNTYIIAMELKQYRASRESLASQFQ